MGKRGNRSRGASYFDSEDDDSVSSSSTSLSGLTLASEGEDMLEDSSKSLDLYLDELYEKRGSTREKALSSIIEAFRNNLQHEFVRKNFFTLLHHNLNSIKRGSAKEISLASQALGLLALTTGYGDDAHEIFKESLTPLSQALTSGSEVSKIACILDCLAVITFVGGNDSEETERAMKIIWEFVHQKSGSNVVASKGSLAVMTSATSAWSFLLTILDGRTLDLKSWQALVSHFSSVLEEDDRSVRITAGEALALLFEIECSEEFSSYAIQGLKQKILDQVRELSVEAGGKGSTKKNLSSQRNLFRDILEFLKDGSCPETSTKIGRDSVNTSTWSALIQLNFFKHFLGGGFFKHMQENELLHDVFGFTPSSSHISGDQQKLSSHEKRMYKSPNSTASKARTQSLKKDRATSLRNVASLAAAGGGEEL